MSGRVSETRLRRPARRSRALDQGVRDAAGARRGRRRVHGPADDRRHARTARPHQDRGVPARPDRRRHAARPARPRISRRPKETHHDRHRGLPRARRPVAVRAASDHLTHVELTWIEKKIEHWIRFGREVHEQILDRRRRVVCFRPGSIFAFVRWASNDFGTVISRIDIVRAVSPRRALSDAAFRAPRRRHPAARSKAGRRSSACSRLIDAIEALGIDPAESRRDHWRHVHNRLTAGHEPRAYTSEQHRAFLKRRRIEP